MSQSVLSTYYISRIKKMSDDPMVFDLFSKVPSSSIYAFKKSLIYNATKEYIESNKLLPNNLFNLIDSYVKENGIIKTYKKYEDEFNKMEVFFNLDKSDFINILKGLVSDNSSDRFRVLEEFKNYIRDYNSKFKGHFIKLYVDKKLKELKTICYKKDKRVSLKSNKIDYSFKDFIKDIKVNNVSLYNELVEYMSDVSNVFVDDIIDDVFTLIDEDANIDAFLKIFGIYKPYNYDSDYILKCRTTNRLIDNFLPIFNNKDYDIEYKKVLVNYLNDKLNNKKIDDYNKLISSGDKMYLELAYHLLIRINGKVFINSDNNIDIESPIKIDNKKIDLYKELDYKISNVNKFINNAKRFWLVEKNKRLSNLNSEIDNDYGSYIFDDNSYIINTESYIHYSMIKELIDNIDMDKIHSLSYDEVNSLRELLNDNDLLFTYLIGNISLNDMLLIINNYSSIVHYLKRYDISINDLDNILRIAKTFIYVNDLDIALIGYDNLVKIINYNQFTGVSVTDDIIKSRIHKAVYLSYKSELVEDSSLPYDIDVFKKGLHLMRYNNNDPELLISGIETKTCFFMSVNENDFFFYSLLNKNGFVIKIVDKDNNFIARASCFRRNNILMINGIRLKNNEINPKNREQKETIREIMNLVEMMADKLIYSTTGDMCPIDYVVCNKAGILENSDYQDAYEMIDFNLIREPINIYSDDWQDFVHINDSDDDLLQEANINPNKSFTTDFGENYPLLLIKSRNNMGLLKPSDISLKDQNAYYHRPRIATKVYTPFEIDDDVLFRINRIRALNTFTGDEKQRVKKQSNFKLIKDISNISKVILADDWVGIIYRDDSKEFACSKYTDETIYEIQKYATYKNNINDSYRKVKRP